MGCNNAFVVRYKVRIENSPYQLIPLKAVAAVTGLSLGTEGVITVREQNKMVEIPDGVLTLPTLGLRLRMDAGLTGVIDMDFFRQWWEDRKKQTKTIHVDICNRAFEEQYTWTYKHCSFFTWNGEDQELAQTKLGYMDFQFKPYEVQFKDAQLKFLRNLA